MPLPLTGVSIDESFSGRQQTREVDHFEAAWKEHAGDADDLADLPDKPASKEKLPAFSKHDPETGELGDSAVMRHIEAAEFEQQVVRGLVEAEDAVADLEAHYGDLGNLSDTLELFCTLVSAIEQDPVAGFGRALEALSGGEGRTRRADAAKGEAELAIGPDGRPFPTASLDRRIERTMASVAKGNHRVSSALAKRVCKAAGTETFADALRMVAKFNRDALAKPFETLQQLAHAKGAPSSPRQLQAWEHNEGLKAQQRQEMHFSQQQIDAFANARDYNGQPAYPHFQQLKTAMAGFLQQMAVQTFRIRPGAAGNGVGR